jgi:hypothetical protein
VADGVGLVGPTLKQPVLHEGLEPGGEHAGGDTEALLELVETGVAVEGVMEDQQGPPLADVLHRRGQRALPVLQPDPACHGDRPFSYC